MIAPGVSRPALIASEKYTIGKNFDDNYTVGLTRV
jgi:hypothetical protein